MAEAVNTLNTAIPRRRDVKLDLLRLLAIIYCIIEHALPQHYADTEGLWWFLSFIPDTGAIFFMASGALILTSDRNADWRYVWHRLTTFLPEFILFSVVYVFMDNWYGFGEVELTARRIALMFVKATWAPGWFILTLIGLYLVLPLLSAWTKTATRRQIEIGIAIWLATTFLPLLKTLVMHFDLQQSVFGTLYNYAGYMLIGYYLARWPFAQRSIKFKAAFFVAASVIGLGFGYFMVRSGLKWGYVHTLTNGLSVNVAMTSLIQYGVILLLPSRWFAGGFGRVITWVSALSLGIYCWHWLVIRYWALPEGISWPLSTLAALCVGIAGAWLMSRARGLITGRFNRR